MPSLSKRIALSPGTPIHFKTKIYDQRTCKTTFIEGTGKVWSIGTTSYNRWVITDDPALATAGSGCRLVPTKGAHSAAQCKDRGCNV